MKLSRTLWILGVLLLLTPLAHADGTTTIQFTGVNGANDGVYYVSPYQGILNYGTSSAQPVVLFCDDINNEVLTGQVWNANVTSLASGNFLNTRYGNGSVNPNLGGASAQILYEEAAWIVSQFASHPSDYVSLQYALWDLMTPNVKSTSYADADGRTSRAQSRAPRTTRQRRQPARALRWCPSALPVGLGRRGRQLHTQNRGHFFWISQMSSRGVD